MNDINPEAVEAVARTFHIGKFPDHADCDPNSVELRNAERYLRLIRDAIHRDGDDADAIRDALGLSIEKREGPRWEQNDDGAWDIATTAKRRVVGEWQSVQP